MVSSRLDRRAILALLGVVALAGRATAQTEPPDNKSGKTVTIKPNPLIVPAANPVTTLTHFEHAWWDTAQPFAGDAKYSGGQRDAFDGFGYDSVSPPLVPQPSKVYNAGVLPNKQGEFPKDVIPTLVTLDTQTVTPNPNGGQPQPFNFQAQASDPKNGDHATAKSAYTLSPLQPDGKTFTLTMSTQEYVDRNSFPGMNSFAFSYAGATYKNALAAMKNGKANTGWNSSVGRIGSGIKERNLARDPMSFQTFDRSGNPVLFNQFYSSVASTIDNATFSADSTGYHLATDTTDGEASLNVHIDGTYLSNVTTGDLNVDLVNGVITQEEASGFFSGVQFSSTSADGVVSLDITNLPSLSLTMNIPDDGDPSNSVLFQVDEATFAAVSVSEPSSLMMGGAAVLAGLVYASRRWWRSRNPK